MPSSIATIDTIRFPEYGNYPFIDRMDHDGKKITEIICSYMGRILHGDEKGNRAINIQGEPGAGKTWLLRHLAERAFNEDTTSIIYGNALGEACGNRAGVIHSLYIDLHEWKDPDNSDQKAKKLIIAIDQIIAKKWANQSRPTIDEDNDQTAPLSDLQRWLEADVRSLFQGNTQALVLLLDHVYLSPDLEGSLRALDGILGMFTAFSRALIITASFGQLVSWSTPALRMPQIIKLNPFSKEQTDQQLSQQLKDTYIPDQLDEIYRLSGGYPRNNFALGYWGLDQKEKAFEEEINYILRVIPEKDLYETRIYLQALCLLPGFGPYEVEFLLTEYLNKENKSEISLPNIRKNLNNLARSRLINWHNGEWHMIERLKTLLTNWLREKSSRENNNDWSLLYETTIRLYTEWAEKYPATQKRWAEKKQAVITQQGA